MNRKTLARWLRRLADRLAAEETWAVRYGNYEPAEIDSTWESKEKAEARIREIEGDDPGSMWEVERW